MIAQRACTNRGSDRRRGRCVIVQVRYADDFIILVSAGDGDPEKARTIAEQEKSSLAAMLEAEMGLTLSPEKTLVTPVTKTMRFLGHHIQVRKDTLRRQLRPRLVIPKDRSKRLRRTIALIFDRRTSTATLEQRLKLLNPVLRGWGGFYQHAWGAKFSKAPALPVNVHRPLMDYENIDETFTWQEQRSLSAALTLKYDKVLYLVDPVQENQRLAGKRVTVIDYPDGRIKIKYEARELGYREFDKLNRTHQGEVVPHKRLAAMLE